MHVFLNTRGRKLFVAAYFIANPTSIYLVYLDNGDYDQEGDTNGCDQSGRDGDIYFTRSDNGGESWEELSVLSNFDEDYGTDLDYSSTTLQYRADVSGTGNDVHVAWTDYNGYTGVSSIYYTKSSIA